MNKPSPTKRITRTVRTALAAAAMAGVGIAGAGIAGASVIGSPIGPITRFPVITCPAPVSLSTTYGYTYNTSTDEVLSLSGSGCSQSANPVKVSVNAGEGWSTTVTPKLVPGTLEYTFSFTDSSKNLFEAGPYYLNAAKATAAETARQPQPFAITYSASQAATGGSSSIWFTLYWDNSNIP